MVLLWKMDGWIMDDTFWVPDSSFFVFFKFSGPIRDSYWCSKSQSHAASYRVKEKSKHLFFFFAPTRISTAVAGLLPTYVFVSYLP